MLKLKTKHLSKNRLFVNRYIKEIAAMKDTYKWKTNKSYFDSFVGVFQKNGKASKAKKMFNLALEDASERMDKPALLIFRHFIVRTGNILEIRKLRVGKQHLEVPFFLSNRRKRSNTFKLLLNSLREEKKLRTPFVEKLSLQLCHIYMGLETKPVAINKRVTATAIKNRSYQVFRW